MKMKRIITVLAVVVLLIIVATPVLAATSIKPPHGGGIWVANVGGTAKPGCSTTSTYILFPHVPQSAMSSLKVDSSNFANDMHILFDQYGRPRGYLDGYYDNCYYDGSTLVCTVYLCGKSSADGSFAGVTYDAYSYKLYR